MVGTPEPETPGVGAPGYQGILGLETPGVLAASGSRASVVPRLRCPNPRLRDIQGWEPLELGTSGACDPLNPGLLEPQRTLGSGKPPGSGTLGVGNPRVLGIPRMLGIPRLLGIPRVLGIPSFGDPRGQGSNPRDPCSPRAPTLGVPDSKGIRPGGSLAPRITGPRVSEISLGS